MRYNFVGKRKEASGDQGDTDRIRRGFCLIKAGDRKNTVYGYSYENAWLYNE